MDAASIIAVVIAGSMLAGICVFACITLLSDGNVTPTPIDTSVNTADEKAMSVAKGPSLPLTNADATANPTTPAANFNGVVPAKSPVSGEAAATNAGVQAPSSEVRPPEHGTVAPAAEVADPSPKPKRSDFMEKPALKASDVFPAPSLAKKDLLAPQVTWGNTAGAGVVPIAPGILPPVEIKGSPGALNKIAPLSPAGGVAPSPPPEPVSAPSQKVGTL